VRISLILNGWKGKIVMKRTLWMACMVLFLTAFAGYAGSRAGAEDKPKERIGIYDSRAIAVAFSGSEAHEKLLSNRKAEFEKAKAAGDEKRVAELKKEGAEEQKLRHKQGFSTAPVDDILECIKDAQAAIKQKANVTVLVSKWDKESLAKHLSAEQIDITMDLVDAFHPKERQRKSALEIQKSQPIPLEQADKIKD
jgi:hypothetical protein